MLDYIQAGWYQPASHSSVVNILLWPLSWLYCALVSSRHWLYRLGLLPASEVDALVIVVGNLTVGGTGKTPLVIALADMLTRIGRKPGIVTRGYGGQSLSSPHLVNARSDPQAVGDEAVLLARRCGVTVLAGSNRVEAARRLIDHYHCDVIISDDGFQHFKLKRDIDIVVIDGERRFGNGRCLPAGPMRETVSGLQRADLVVNTGAQQAGEFTVLPEISIAVLLYDPEQRVDLAQFAGSTVHAIAAIGHPERFFRQLEQLGIEVKRHLFADHHIFTQADLDFNDAPLLMTEKDAVKCERLTLPPNTWFIPLNLRLDDQFKAALNKLL